MRSWLRHVEGCQIAELNWKPSSTWAVCKDAPSIMDVARDHFRIDLRDDVFKEQTAAQLLRQTEIDVLGIRFDPPHGKIEKIYCVDVAFHEDGLHYKGGIPGTVNRV